MSTSGGDRTEELFHQALELEETERAAFLAKACRDDPLLKEKVDRLLEAREKAFDFPEKPAWVMFGSDEDPEEEQRLPFEKLGEFKLLRRIGEGGMGAAYLAIQESLNRQVVLKVIRPGGIDSEEAKARFQREAQSVSNLNHPNIVTVYSSGEEQGVNYFAMEWVPGRGMDEVLRESSSRGGEIPLPTLLSWFKEIADALHTAHGAGIIHRDVKPANIRITPEGKPVLLDFGVARHVKLSSLTLAGQFRGTPHYASPQQVQTSNVEIDGRTDVYSLGVTLYEAATGRLPFQGDTTARVFNQILSEDPASPRRVNRDLPRDLETIILKAMEKEPGRRYPDMGELAEDIERLISGEPIKARPVGFPNRAIRWIRRHRARSAAMALALLALTVLAVSVPLYLAKRASEKIAADSAFLSRLQGEAEALYPAHPEKIPRMKAWLEEAAVLTGRIESLQRTLEELRAESLPGSNEEAGWTFADEALQGRHNAVAKLMADFTSFMDQRTGSLRQVERLLEFTRTVHHETFEKYGDRWNRAIASIADREECACYQGMRLTPILGLVPMGRDPDSGFWEFAHLQTGSVPERGPDGKIVLTEESGLVLVLIPGGRFDMGAVRLGEDHPSEAPNVDPHADRFERPVHTVTLAPFFLSKFEMTQGQWLRFTGGNPSYYPAGAIFVNENEIDERTGQYKVLSVHTLLNPVDNMTWNESKRVLQRLGLKLPSEAEWEYAARGGTSTVWWTGNDRNSLDGAVNVKDLSYSRHMEMDKASVESWLDDGYIVDGSVNTLRPNPFGLHHVLGNVREWCEDTRHEGYEGAPADGSAWIDSYLKERIIRGGTWDTVAGYGRSAARHYMVPTYRSAGLGVRPAMTLPQTDRSE